MFMPNSNKFIDVHGHIQFPDFDADREVVIKRAREAGVKMIAVGTQAETSRRAIEVARQFPNDVWATVGFHPTEIGSENFDIKALRKLAADPKVVAISECGFDLFRDSDNLKLQENVFSEQADLAGELSKPLMMHCRPSKGTDDAYEYALGVLNDSKFKDLKKIMHFYAGSLDMAKKLANLGFYFTFGGVITFLPGRSQAKAGAESYNEIIRYLPLDRIFIETDCPYVAPQSHRGKRNEPAYVVETAHKLAELKGLDFERVAEELYKNSVNVFNLM